MAKRDKHQRAAQLAEEAVGNFRDAQVGLCESIALLNEAEEEHRAEAEAHLAKAETAKTNREQHERIYGRINDLLS